MLADLHMHTSFSPDSTAEPARMIEAAIQKGIRTVCITDHMDYDCPIPEDNFTFDTDVYFTKLHELQRQYSGQIEVLIGVEIGLQLHLKQWFEQYLASYPFDYVIGSVHLVNGQDPYYHSTFDGHTDEEIFGDYLKGLLENIRSFHAFDSLGHLDYVVRYGKQGEGHYSYEMFSEVIDAILQLLIDEQISLEVNTAGIRKTAGNTNPHEDVLRRFYEMGGRRITMGADAHKPRYVGSSFAKTGALLREIGFLEEQVYRKRQPCPISLQ